MNHPLLPKDKRENMEHTKAIVIGMWRQGAKPREIFNAMFPEIMSITEPESQTAFVDKIIEDYQRKLSTLK